MSGLSLSSGDVLSAKADASGKVVSLTSASTTVLNGAVSAPAAPVLSAQTLMVGSTSQITGTSGNGRLILYIDGELLDSSAANNLSNASWTITLSAANQARLTRGATISAKNRDPSTGLYSSQSNTLTVTGVSNFLITDTLGNSVSTQTAGVRFPIKLNAVNGSSVTITSYTGKNSIVGTYSVDTGSVTANFSSGLLNTHYVTLNRAGTYVLKTVSEADPTVIGTSNSFTVVAGPAAQLSVITQVSTYNSVSNSFGTQPQLQITDRYGNLVQSTDPNAAAQITVHVYTGGGALIGTTQTAATNGAAAFSNLGINAPGEYRLKFTATGMDSAVSGSFYVGRVWIGSADTAFSVGNNWSNSTLPNTNEDIAFATSPVRDLVLPDNRVIGSYYNYSSKKLKVNGKKLTIKGSINHSSASIDASATGSDVEFAGTTGVQTIAANTFVGDSAYKVTINNSDSVILAGTLKITGEVKPQAGKFSTNGHLTLRSTSIANTAVVSQGSASGGYITGEVTVERYFPPRRAYRLITSPVSTSPTSAKPYIRDNWQEGVNNTAAGYTNNLNPNPGYGTHISGPQGSAAGFDVTQSTNASLFIWNPSTQGWNALTNTNATTITAGATYRLMIRGDRSIDYSTNTPTPTYTILRTTGTLAPGRPECRYTQ